MKKTLTLVLLTLLLILSLSACDILTNTDDSNGSIKGSGHIAANTVSVSPEFGGKVAEVLAAESDNVQEGEILIRFDDQIYQAQYNQAIAAVGVAESAVDTQKAQYDAAMVNFEMVVQGTRFQEQPIRNASWLVPQPDEFDLPPWYFEKNENYAAAKAELETAETNLDSELSNLDKELADASNADLIAAETRLAEARMAYAIAEQTRSQIQGAQDNEKLEEIAQEEVEAALSDLEAAQFDYQRMLSTSSYDDVLDARGRVAVARNRFDNTRDYVDQFQTGEDSLQVEAANMAVQLADAGVKQAEAAVEQAKAAVQTLKVQIAKTVIYAPTSGVILARNLEVGEVVGPGSSSIIIGELDAVELTVYIAEDRYGQINLGQDATITVDSFPGEVFEGSVIRIADEAEFTPRNVQTVDGRKSTVYAVVISVPNPELKLKPGMPADAIIDVGE